MNKLLSFGLVVFVFIFSIITLYQAYDIYNVKKQVENEIKDTEKKVAEYNEKKSKIENNIKSFDENAKIERIARERLNLKKEGEITYKIVD